MGASESSAPDRTDPGKPGFQEAVLRAIGDPLSRQVLLELSDAPRSASDLLESTHVPQSTLYRRLSELREMGLVDVQCSVITDGGKKTELFRSLIERAEIQWNGSSLRVIAKRRDLASERLAALWGGLREGGTRP